MEKQAFGNMTFRLESNNITENEFWIRVADLKDGNHQLRLVSIHANGAAIVNRVHYATKDGVPNFANTNKEIAKITIDGRSGSGT